jgi:hypothetical protein
MDPDKSCYVRCSAVDAAEGTLTFCFIVFVYVVIMSYEETLHSNYHAILFNFL